MNKMTKRSNDPILNQDDQLADYVDRVRNAGINQTDSGADQELLGLEETILRLNRSFPKEALDEETIKRMQADFTIRRRRLDMQEQSNRPPLLRALFQSPLVLAAAALVLIGVFVFLSPSLTPVEPGLTGAAGLQIRLIYLLPIVGVVVLLALWLGRRK